MRIMAELLNGYLSEICLQTVRRDEPAIGSNPAATFPGHPSIARARQMSEHGAQTLTPSSLSSSRESAHTPAWELVSFG
jgi:hypothetical protein